MNVPSLPRFPLVLGAVALILLLAAPFYTTSFNLTLAMKAMAFAGTSLAFNLLFGYTGLLSLGHAMFFGGGAYVTAYMVKRMGVQSLEILLPMSGIGAMILAALVGAVAVRYTKIHFLIITLGFSQMLYGLVLKFYTFTGGTDGLGPVSGLRFFGLPISLRDYSLYYFAIGVFLLITFLLWVIVRSHFGKALQAIKENTTRATYVGIPQIRYKYYAFVISGFFSGLAGTIWAIATVHVAPDSLYWILSADIIFITLLGGYAWFIGPILGSFIFVYLQNTFMSLTGYWMLPLGAIFIAILIFARGGVAMLVYKYILRARR
ncbi:MAG: branched-chain amino acid ABC transporter permease [Aigarchaeota archaeon]|nr:branched-chain amino acid ABC transporter permease [Aigarchaeota archaeon]MDW8092067.1 branched-chain amino acid ABC transporter permease [Nitrososphaerota archaeon]